ncbi:MAG: hypothetical protein GY757_13685, partial [bacterium]|nr:hypothetical protein [bacterium]
IIKDEKYKRGFNEFSGSRLHKNVNALSTRKGKPLPPWFLVTVFIVLVLFISIITYVDETGFLEREARREHQEKIYAFGNVPTRDLALSLKSLQAWHEDNFQPVARTLNPGLTRKQIDEIMQGLPVKPFEEMYTLYTWRNGQPGSTDILLIPGFRFLPLEVAVNAYKNMQKIARDSNLENWKPLYFPIFKFYNRCIVVACAGVRRGTLLKRSIETDRDYIAYPSIAGMMQEITEYYETGAFYITDEGYVGTDEEKKHK